MLGAFGFPVPQGSQLYFASQARMLAAAGADVTLVCYGSGDGRDAAAMLGDAPVRLLRTPRWIAPRRLRAGPDLRKPAADLALAASLLRAHRAAPFDGVLAHNAEAMAVASLVAGLMRVPVVYVAHTLWRDEAGSYARPSPVDSCGVSETGSTVGCAARADAVIALSSTGAEALAPAARGPVEEIPPPALAIQDEDAGEAAAAARRYGLDPDGYAVYAGNLDRYQDLEIFDAAVRALALPGVVVTANAATPDRFDTLRPVIVADADETTRLVRAARIAVLPRRRRGASR